MKFVDPLAKERCLEAHGTWKVLLTGLITLHIINKAEVTYTRPARTVRSPDIRRYYNSHEPPLRIVAGDAAVIQAGASCDD